jgi:hypothetical protein
MMIPSAFRRVSAVLECHPPFRSDPQDIGTDSYGNPAAVRKNWAYDDNVLKMMKFAQDHGKPMIASESGFTTTC